MNRHHRKLARKMGWICGLLAFGALSLAKPAVVITQSGQRYEGDVTEKANEVIINIRGVETRISRDEIAAIEYSKSFDDEFNDRLSKLTEGDAAGRIELARWAMQQEQYTKARDALELALQADPNSAEATQMLTLVRSQMRVANQSRNNTPRSANAAEIDQKREDLNAIQRNLLHEDDVQKIRRIEWKQGDTGVRVRVDSKLAKQYADMRQQRWEDFGRLKQADQARAILDDQNATPEQRAGVTIMNDPPAIADFRRSVQPIILNGCATSGCHGGPDAGKFTLVSPATTDEATYTNFYVLTNYKKQLQTVVPAGGIFGGMTEIEMIDRGNPQRSLLVQYSLPADVAEFDHPAVNNYQPLFQNVFEARARPMIAWIERTLRLNPDASGINYTPTFGGAATQPVSR